MKYDDAFTVQYVEKELVEIFNFMAGCVPFIQKLIDKVGSLPCCPVNLNLTHIHTLSLTLTFFPSLSPSPPSLSPLYTSTCTRSPSPSLYTSTSTCTRSPSLTLSRCQSSKKVLIEWIKLWCLVWYLLFMNFIVLECFIYFLALNAVLWTLKYLNCRGNLAKLSMLSRRTTMSWRLIRCASSWSWKESRAKSDRSFSETSEWVKRLHLFI